MNSQRLLFTFLLLFSGLFVTAQETTSTISGLVTDDKGTPVQGASIVLNHSATGSKTGAQTNNKGIFVIPNLKPGGPYSISISFVGFQTEKSDSVNLALGSNPDINVVLRANDKSMQEVVIAGNKKGIPGLNISRSQLSTLPTLGRSLSDFTRLTPQSNNNSFAGTNFRYNN